MKLANLSNVLNSMCTALNVVWPTYSERKCTPNVQIICRKGSVLQDVLMSKKPCPFFLENQHIQLDKTPLTHSIMVLHHRTEMVIQSFCLSGWTFDLTKSLIETNESQFNPFNLCHFCTSFIFYSHHTMYCMSKESWTCSIHRK